MARSYQTTIFVLLLLLMGIVCGQAREAEEQSSKVTISGVILSEEEYPISNALIIVLDCALTPQGTFKSDAEGKFLFQTDSEQACFIRIQKDGFIPIDMKKESLVAKSRDFSITLQQACKVAGTILDGVSLIPLKGVQVKLQGKVEGSAPESSQSAKTDETGRFLFSNIAKGSYLFDAGKESYIPHSESLSLKGGEQKSYTIFLFKESSLQGSVSDPEQKGIQGAEIKLLKNLSLFFKEKGKIFQGGEYRAVSSENGRFSIKGMPEYDGYRISISAEGFASQIIEKDIRAGVNTLAVNLQKASSIRGRLRDERGRILLDAAVAIQSHSEEMLQGLPDIFKKSYHPTETGLFRIDGLPAGNFTLTIDSPAHVPGTYEILSLKAGEDRDLGDIKLSSGLSIAGVVNDEKGEKISKARIRAALSGYGGKLFVKDAESGDDGTFSVGGLKEGIYSVHAEAEGYIADEKKGIRTGTKNLVFTLKSGGTIHGTVVSEDGKPLTAFYISIEPEEAIDLRESAFHRSFSSETGSYKISGLKPGRYTVSAQAPGYSDDTKKGAEILPGVEMGAIDFTLKRGGKIDGFVYEKDQGLPVPGANVSIIMQGFQNETLSAITDASGYFSLEGVPLKFISIVADHPDYAPSLIEDIDPTGRESTFPLKIYLQAGGTVEGYVLEADDSPVSGARLSINQRGKVLEALSDMSGYYHIDHVPAGTCSIVKTLPRLDYFSDYESKDFSIKNNDIIRIDFKSFAEASGYVTKKGTPIEGARITFIEVPAGADFDSSKLSARSSFTDATGFYRIKGLKDGRYSVSVENAEKSFSKIVVIPKVKEFRYDISCPDYEISGRVLDGETTMPVPQATVVSWLAETKNIALFDMDREIDGAVSKITGATADMQSTMTDSEGFFSFLVEKPGKYSVTAQSTGYLRKPVVVTIPQAAAPIEIALFKGAVLKGTVRTERGTLLSAGGIQMVREGYSFGTSISADGKFVFDDLDPATYALYIFAPALAPLITENLIIESGKTYEEEFVIKEGAPLKLLITPPNKAVKITIVDSSSRDFFNLFLLYLEEEIAVEEEGGKTVYSFPNLPPGAYKVTVTAKKVTKEKALEVFNGTPASLDFEF